MTNTMLPEKIARALFMQIMSGIFHLHLHNVVHRDMKPDNILLDDQQNLKIADFGLSGISEDINSMNFMTACGTEAYTAPEIFSLVKESSKEQQPEGYKGKPVDIFSCGVILFMMTLGTCPFTKAVPEDPAFALIREREWIKYWSYVEKDLDKSIDENLK